MNTEPINFNANNDHYEALKTCQDKYTKDSDTHKDSFPFPIGSTVPVQHEDDGPWTHGIVKETNGTYHQEQSYIILVMKTGRLIMSNMVHIHSTPVTTE